jgi:HD-GYP domain-containing protein (c-di-GMP phosphodiesterase class II)
VGDMKIKMNVNDLRVGMYVCELDRPWRGTPFLFQGFEIRSADDIGKVKEFCKEVYVLKESIATTTGAGARAWRDWNQAASPAAKHAAELQFEQELLKLNNHPTARSIYEDKTTLEEEIQLVKGAYAEARKAIDEFLRDVRMGRSLDGVVVRRIVGQLADSVLRNPDALTCYAQLKRKDNYLAMHGLRCAILALIFGRQLGLSRDQIDELGMAGLLHDLGMVKVPDEILNKPGRLSPIELAIVRRHVNWGAEMLEHSPGMPAAVVEAARNHHERFDGSGYLQGLAGEAIGQSGLIMGIVDYYDAVTSDRPYQSATSPYAAMRSMYAGRGKLFHPELIERFIQCLGIYPVGSVVELSTGEVGVVVALNRQARLKPRVALVRQADHNPYPVPPVVNLTARRMADGVPCDIERVLDPVEADIDPVRYLPVSGVV